MLHNRVRRSCARVLMVLTSERIVHQDCRVTADLVVFKDWQIIVVVKVKHMHATPVIHTRQPLDSGLKRDAVTTVFAGKE